MKIRVFRSILEFQVQIVRKEKGIGHGKDEQESEDFSKVVIFMSITWNSI